MKTKVAIDVSGLAWRYRTGVQNLYWAFISTYFKNTEYQERYEVNFYDRSGIFNNEIAQLISQNYQSCAPLWWPGKFRRPLQVFIKLGLRAPQLDNSINHVWNWDIYAPSDSSHSITIPDILPVEYPHWFSYRFQRQTESAIKFAVDKATFVNCISNDVRDRLINYSGINPKKVRVIYPGIDDSYFLPVDGLKQDIVLKNFNLRKNEFVISSGFLDPRKNLKKQIEAFSIYLDKSKVRLKYVLTGLKTNLSDEILELVNKPGIRENIIFLGYINSEELRLLTSAAACVMYCSIAEGFGLPIIEAMALGVPVITSSTSSMVELAKGRAALACPDSSDSIASAIENTIETIGSQEHKEILLSNIDFAKSFTNRRWLDLHLDHMTEKS